MPNPEARVSGNNAKNRQVHGALSLHVDDPLMTGDDVFEKEIMGRLRKDVQVGSEENNDSLRRTAHPMEAR